MSKYDWFNLYHLGVRCEREHYSRLGMKTSRAFRLGRLAGLWILLRVEGGRKKSVPQSVLSQNGRSPTVYVFGIGDLKTQCLTDCSRPQDGDDGARLLLVYWDSVHLLSKVSTYAGWGVWYPPNVDPAGVDAQGIAGEPTPNCGP